MHGSKSETANNGDDGRPQSTSTDASSLSSSFCGETSRRIVFPTCNTVQGIRRGKVKSSLYIVVALLIALLNVRFLSLFGNRPLYGMSITAAEVLPKIIETENPTSIKTDKDEFQIIILTMDRFHALERLLQSLQATDYAGDKVNLEIRFDFPKHPTEEWKQRVEAFRSNITWSAGDVSVKVATENRGLRKSWLVAWWPKSDKERALILEDDIEVSPLWYKWIQGAYAAYGYNSDIVGFSLQRQTLVADKKHRSNTIPDNDGRPFLYRLVGSIGYAPIASKWLDFLDFAECALHTDMKVNTPKLITSDWYNSLDKRGMWTQLFIYFCKETDLYTLYAYPRGNKALAAHWREKGEHSRKTEGRDYQLVRAADNWPIEYPDNLPKLDWDARVHPASKLRSLVLSGAVGYGAYEFKRFVTNLRAHYDGDIALLVWEKAPSEIFALLEKYNIQAVKTPEAGGERASPAWYKVNQVRWQFYQEACRQDKYDLCMAVDFRDTLFQDNPFRGMVPAEEGKAVLHVYEHNLPMNAWHLDQAQRCKQSKNVLIGKNIINAGGFIASPPTFPQLAEWILQDAKKCDDQVALNIGVHGGVFKADAVAHKQGEGSINNVAWGGKFRRDSRRRFLNHNCLPSPAVHQFDVVGKTWE